MRPTKVCVLGDGAWGTAIANLVAFNGYDVMLWSHSLENSHAIRCHGENKRYLPGARLSPNITSTADLQKALRDADFIFEAIPVQYLKNIIQDAAKFINPNAKFIVLSKGIDKDLLLFPGQILKKVLGPDINISVISGPNYARELANQKLTGMMIASNSFTDAREIINMVETEYVKTYFTDQILGIQILGALKNLAALQVGILQGREEVNNTSAFILTNLLNEIKIILRFYKCSDELVDSLAGFGDIILSSFLGHSKNKDVGIKLGQGMKLDLVLPHFISVPESPNTLYAVNKLIQKNKLECPTIRALYEFVYKKDSI